MLNRRNILKQGGVASMALAVTAVQAGVSPADAAGLADLQARKLPDPATTPVPNPPYPAGLTPEERRHLKTFDELDFKVFSNAKWNRLDESHAKNVRVHWPDGHITKGIEQHIADLSAMFVWAPDTRIKSHPLRVASGQLTAVTGVMQGTFTKPMPDGEGGFIQPTGKAYAINMCTVGMWNRKGVMSEEFLFWDDANFYRQIGLG